MLPFIVILFVCFNNENEKLEILSRPMAKKIYHRNDAHQDLVHMEISARRILYICLSEMEREYSHESKKTSIVFNPDQVFNITAKDYAELCAISPQEAYRQLKEGVYAIRKYDMTIPEAVLNPENKSKPKDWMNIFTVASSAGYSVGQGFVSVKLAPEFAPYISDLNTGFTGQFLLQALQLPQGNPYSLYLLLSKWVSAKKTRYCEIGLEDLKQELGASSPAYERFSTFKNQFFIRASKQVVALTEFSSISLEIVSKKSRKVDVVRVSYSFVEPGICNDAPNAEIEPSNVHSSSEEQQTQPPENIEDAVVISDAEIIARELGKLNSMKKLSPSDKLRKSLYQQGKIPSF